MATTLRYLLSKSSTSLKLSNQHSNKFPPISQLLRALHSLASRNFHCHSPNNSRTFSTSPQYFPQDSDSSIAAALNLDSRVPATVITGFLGSGKVTPNLPSSVSICLSYFLSVPPFILVGHHAKNKWTFFILSLQLIACVKCKQLQLQCPLTF